MLYNNYRTTLERMSRIHKKAYYGSKLDEKMQYFWNSVYQNSILIQNKFQSF